MDYNMVQLTALQMARKKGSRYRYHFSRYVPLLGLGPSNGHSSRRRMRYPLERLPAFKAHPRDLTLVIFVH